MHESHFESLWGPLALTVIETFALEINVNLNM